MATNINLFIENLEVRHNEIKILLENIKILEEKNDKNSKKLYNSLCRSTSILLVSHLEGFIKDFTKELISDLNQFKSFSDINTKIKKHYLSSYFDDSESKKSNSYHLKVKRLQEKFENIEKNFIDYLTTNFTIDNIKLESIKKNNFILLEKEVFLTSNNQNPKADVIEKLCLNFGIENIFSYLKESDLEIVFQNNYNETKELTEEILKTLLEKTKEFPFKENTNNYKLERVPISYKEKTNWELFLEELLQKRHQIVHGNEINNSTNYYELRDYEQKTTLIQYGILLVFIDSVYLKN